MPKVVRAVLTETGVDYDIEPRKKHDLLRVEGEIVGVLSKGSKTKYRTALNTAQRIKRKAQELSK
jgi:hypothetical protein